MSAYNFSPIESLIELFKLKKEGHIYFQIWDISRNFLLDPIGSEIAMICIINGNWKKMPWGCWWSNLVIIHGEVEVSEEKSFWRKDNDDRRQTDGNKTKVMRQQLTRGAKQSIQKFNKIAHNTKKNTHNKKITELALLLLNQAYAESWLPEDTKYISKH